MEHSPFWWTVNRWVKSSWDVTPCRSVSGRRCLKIPYFLRYQGQVAPRSPLDCVKALRIFRNGCNFSPSDTASHPRILKSAVTSLWEPQPSQSTPTFWIKFGVDKGWIELKGRRRRRRKQLMYYINERKGCWKLKEDALARSLWRTRFRRGYGWTCRITNNEINEYM